MIKHIEFWVSNLERSINFYKVIFEIIGGIDFIEGNAFTDGNIKIYFIEQNVELQRTLGPRHICFLVSSHSVVDNVGEFLTRNNCDIIRGPMESHYKDRSSYTIDFRDPDGYIIELATESEISE